MNALANDQIDRLRKTFIEYPDITFGCYTGQTRHHDKTAGKEKGAIDQYLELNNKRMDDVRLQKPLPNERLSRDSMKENPPHILITNYAMLEYLIAFSDSRQAAAYFSSYFSVSYDGILYGRLIRDELENAKMNQIEIT